MVACVFVLAMLTSDWSQGVPCLPSYGRCSSSTMTLNWTRGSKYVNIKTSFLDRDDTYYNSLHQVLFPDYKLRDFRLCLWLSSLPRHSFFFPPLKSVSPLLWDFDLIVVGSSMSSEHSQSNCCLMFKMLHHGWKIVQQQSGVAVSAISQTNKLSLKCCYIKNAMHSLLLGHYD